MSSTKRKTVTASSPAMSSRSASTNSNAQISNTRQDRNATAITSEVQKKRQGGATNLKKMVLKNVRLPVKKDGSKGLESSGTPSRDRPISTPERLGLFESFLNLQGSPTNTIDSDKGNEDVATDSGTDSSKSQSSDKKYKGQKSPGIVCKIKLNKDKGYTMTRLQDDATADSPTATVSENTSSTVKIAALSKPGPLVRLKALKESDILKHTSPSGSPKCSPPNSPSSTPKLKRRGSLPVSSPLRSSPRNRAQKNSSANIRKKTLSKNKEEEVTETSCVLSGPNQEQSEQADEHVLTERDSPDLTAAASGSSVLPVITAEDKSDVVADDKDAGQDTSSGSDTEEMDDSQAGPVTISSGEEEEVIQVYLDEENPNPSWDETLPSSDTCRIHPDDISDEADQVRLVVSSSEDEEDNAETVLVAEGKPLTANDDPVLLPLANDPPADLHKDGASLGSITSVGHDGAVSEGEGSVESHDEITSISSKSTNEGTIWDTTLPEDLGVNKYEAISAPSEDCMTLDAFAKQGLKQSSAIKYEVEPLDINFVSDEESNPDPSTKNELENYSSETPVNVKKETLIDTDNMKANTESENYDQPPVQVKEEPSVNTKISERRSRSGRAIKMSSLAMEAGLFDETGLSYRLDSGRGSRGRRNRGTDRMSNRTPLDVSPPHHEVPVRGGRGRTRGRSRSTQRVHKEAPPYIHLEHQTVKEEFDDGAKLSGSGVLKLGFCPVPSERKSPLSTELQEATEGKGSKETASLAVLATASANQGCSPSPSAALMKSICESEALAGKSPRAGFRVCCGGAVIGDINISEFTVAYDNSGTAGEGSEVGHSSSTQHVVDASLTELPSDKASSASPSQALLDDITAPEDVIRQPMEDGQDNHVSPAFDDTTTYDDAVCTDSKHIGAPGHDSTEKTECENAVTVTVPSLPVQGQEVDKETSASYKCSGKTEAEICIEKMMQDDMSKIELTSQLEKPEPSKMDLHLLSLINKVGSALHEEVSSEEESIEENEEGSSDSEDESEEESSEEDASCRSSPQPSISGIQTCSAISPTDGSKKPQPSTSASDHQPRCTISTPESSKSPPPPFSDIGVQPGSTKSPPEGCSGSQKASTNLDQETSVSSPDRDRSRMLSSELSHDQDCGGTDCSDSVTRDIQNLSTKISEPSPMDIEMEDNVMGHQDIKMDLSNETDCKKGLEAIATDTYNSDDYTQGMNEDSSKNSAGLPANSDKDDVADGVIDFDVNEADEKGITISDSESSKCEWEVDCPTIHNVQLISSDEEDENGIEDIRRAIQELQQRRKDNMRKVALESRRNELAHQRFEQTKVAIDKERTSIDQVGKQFLEKFNAEEVKKKPTSPTILDVIVQENTVKKEEGEGWEVVGMETDAASHEDVGKYEEKPSRGSKDHVMFERARHKQGAAFLSTELDDYLKKNKVPRPAIQKMGTLFKRKLPPLRFTSSSEATAQQELVGEQDTIRNVTFFSFKSKRGLQSHFAVEVKSGSSGLGDERQGEELPQNMSSGHVRNTGARKKVISEKGRDYSDFIIGKGILESQTKKTSDVTQIKGWKRKYSNEDLADGSLDAGASSGSLHWRTQARLVKALTSDQMYQLGLNLKKRRRRTPIFTHRKVGTAKAKDAAPPKLTECQMAPPNKRRKSDDMPDIQSDGARYVRKMEPKKDGSRVKYRPGPKPKSLDRDVVSQRLCFRDRQSAPYYMSRLSFDTVKVNNEMASYALNALTIFHEGQEEAEDHWEEGMDTAHNSPPDLPCDKPGCLYGCVCHLCEPTSAADHVSVTSEQSASHSTACDKEYCRLGCICESLNAIRKPDKQHCGKMECMFECSCGKQDPDLQVENDGDPGSVVIDPGDSSGGHETAVSPGSSVEAAQRTESSKSAKKGKAGWGKEWKAKKQASWSQKQTEDLRSHDETYKPQKDKSDSAYKYTQPKNNLTSDVPVRKSKRLKNHQGLGKIDMINSLIFFDTPAWLSEGKKRNKPGSEPASQSSKNSLYKAEVAASGAGKQRDKLDKEPPSEDRDQFIVLDSLAAQRRSKSVIRTKGADGKVITKPRDDHLQMKRARLEKIVHTLHRSQVEKPEEEEEEFNLDQDLLADSDDDAETITCARTSIYLPIRWKKKTEPQEEDVVITGTEPAAKEICIQPLGDPVVLHQSGSSGPPIKIQSVVSLGPQQQQTVASLQPQQSQSVVSLQPQQNLLCDTKNLRELPKKRLSEQHKHGNKCKVTSEPQDADPQPVSERFRRRSTGQSSTSGGEQGKPIRERRISADSRDTYVREVPEGFDAAVSFFKKSPERMPPPATNQPPIEIQPEEIEIKKENSRFKTQMVLLQRKTTKPSWKQSEAERLNIPHLLEIHTNCVWESIRSQFLSHMATMLENVDYPQLKDFSMDGFHVEVLPKPDQPTPLPPNLRQTMPQYKMFAIRLRISEEIYVPAYKKRSTESPVVNISQLSSLRVSVAGVAQISGSKPLLASQQQYSSAGVTTVTSSTDAPIMLKISGSNISPIPAVLKPGCGPALSQGSSSSRIALNKSSRSLNTTTLSSSSASNKTVVMPTLVVPSSTGGTTRLVSVISPQKGKGVMVQDKGKAFVIQDKGKAFMVQDGTMTSQLKIPLSALGKNMNGIPGDVSRAGPTLLRSVASLGPRMPLVTRTTVLRPIRPSQPTVVLPGVKPLILPRGFQIAHFKGALPPALSRMPLCIAAPNIRLEGPVVGHLVTDKGVPLPVRVQAIPPQPGDMPDAPKRLMSVIQSVSAGNSKQNTSAASPMSPLGQVQVSDLAASSEDKNTPTTSGTESSALSDNCTTTEFLMTDDRSEDLGIEPASSTVNTQSNQTLDTDSSISEDVKLKSCVFRDADISSVQDMIAPTQLLQTADNVCTDSLDEGGVQSATDDTNLDSKTSQETALSLAENPPVTCPPGSGNCHSESDMEQDGEELQQILSQAQDVSLESHLTPEPTPSGSPEISLLKDILVHEKTDYMTSQHLSFSRTPSQDSRAESQSIEDYLSISSEDSCSKRGRASSVDSEFSEMDLSQDGEEEDLDILDYDDSTSAAAVLRHELNLTEPPVNSLPNKGRRKQHHEERVVPSQPVEFMEEVVMLQNVENQDDEEDTPGGRTVASRREHLRRLTLGELERQLAAPAAMPPHLHRDQVLRIERRRRHDIAYKFEALRLVLGMEKMNPTISAPGKAPKQLLLDEAVRRIHMLELEDKRLREMKASLARHTQSLVLCIRALKEVKRSPYVAMVVDEETGQQVVQEQPVTPATLPEPIYSLPAVSAPPPKRLQTTISPAPVIKKTTQSPATVLTASQRLAKMGIMSQGKHGHPSTAASQKIKKHKRPASGGKKASSSQGYVVRRKYHPIYKQHELVEKAQKVMDNVVQRSISEERLWKQTPSHIRKKKHMSEVMDNRNMNIMLCRAIVPEPDDSPETVAEEPPVAPSPPATSESPELDLKISDTRSLAGVETTHIEQYSMSQTPNSPSQTASNSLNLVGVESALMEHDSMPETSNSPPCSATNSLNIAGVETTHIELDNSPETSSSPPCSASNSLSISGVETTHIEMDNSPETSNSPPCSASNSFSISGVDTTHIELDNSPETSSGPCSATNLLGISGVETIHKELDTSPETSIGPCSVTNSLSIAGVETTHIELDNSPETSNSPPCSATNSLSIAGVDTTHIELETSPETSNSPPCSATNSLSIAGVETTHIEMDNSPETSNSPPCSATNSVSLAGVESTDMELDSSPEPSASLSRSVSNSLSVWDSDLASSFI